MGVETTELSCEGNESRWKRAAIKTGRHGNESHPPRPLNAKLQGNSLDDTVLMTPYCRCFQIYAPVQATSLPGRYPDLLSRRRRCHGKNFAETPEIPATECITPPDGIFTPRCPLIRFSPTTTPTITGISSSIPETGACFGLGDSLHPPIDRRVSMRIVNPTTAESTSITPDRSPGTGVPSPSGIRGNTPAKETVKSPAPRTIF